MIAITGSLSHAMETGYRSIVDRQDAAIEELNRLRQMYLQQEQEVQFLNDLRELHNASQALSDRMERENIAKKLPRWRELELQREALEKKMVPLFRKNNWMKISAEKRTLDPWAVKRIEHDRAPIERYLEDIGRQADEIQKEQDDLGI